MERGQVAAHAPLSGEIQKVEAGGEYRNFQDYLASHSQVSLVEDDQQNSMHRLASASHEAEHHSSRSAYETDEEDRRSITASGFQKSFSSQSFGLVYQNDDVEGPYEDDISYSSAVASSCSEESIANISSIESLSDHMLKKLSNDNIRGMLRRRVEGRD